MRVPLVFCLLLMVAGNGFCAQEIPDVLTDPRDRSTFAWLAKHIGGEPKVSGRDNSSISFENAEASCRLTLDEAGRVVGLRTNKAGFNNDDLVQLAGFRHLTQVGNDHNFDHEGPNGYRTGPNPMSGAGWIAFKDHGITHFRIAGCNFDGDGLRAVAQFPELQHLDVFHTRVSDQDLEALRGHPTLESFNSGPMWDDKISNATLAVLGTLPQLKRFKIVETYLSYDGGFEHIVKFGDQLETIELGNTVVPAADLARLRQAVPETAIEQKSMAEIGQLILDNWKGADRKLSEWAPAEVLEAYRTAAKANQMSLVGEWLGQAEGQADPVRMIFDETGHGMIESAEGRFPMSYQEDRSVTPHHLDLVATPNGAEEPKRLFSLFTFVDEDTVRIATPGAERPSELKPALRFQRVIE